MNNENDKWSGVQASFESSQSEYVESATAFPTTIFSPFCVHSIFCLATAIRSCLKCGERRDVVYFFLSFSFGGGLSP